MILLSCLNYFSCGITNKLNYETCVDHAHSLNAAMVACIILSSYITLLHHYFKSLDCPQNSNVTSMSRFLPPRCLYRSTLLCSLLADNSTGVNLDEPMRTLRTSTRNI